MRAAAALVAAAAVLQACSRSEQDSEAILLASLAELGKELEGSRLPVCAILSERQPLARRSWAFVQAEPPSGFEEVADGAPVAGPLSLEPLRRRLSRPWFMPDDARETCFQLTRPAARDARAVVTGAFRGGGGDGDLSDTWNFWLRREDGRWKVVATTKGHHDI